MYCTSRELETPSAWQKALSSKSYETILNVSKKGMKPDKPADFSDELDKIIKAIA